MKNQLIQMWKEAKTYGDYIIALWITVLATAAGLGLIAFTYNLIFKPETITF